MTGTALILGSTGRFGQTAAVAYMVAGWTVTEWRRSDPAAIDEGRIIRGDLFEGEALIKAAHVDVIVNALNPAYPDWAVEGPPHDVSGDWRSKGDGRNGSDTGQYLQLWL